MLALAQERVNGQALELDPESAKDQEPGPDRGLENALVPERDRASEIALVAARAPEQEKGPPSDQPCRGLGVVSDRAPVIDLALEIDLALATGLASGIAPVLATDRGLVIDQDLEIGRGREKGPGAMNVATISMTD